MAAPLEEPEEPELLLLREENQALKIQLEATREAGVQALRWASKQLQEAQEKRAEELKKFHEQENQDIQVLNGRHEEELRGRLQRSKDLLEELRTKGVLLVEMKMRIKRMEEEKQQLLEKKVMLEKKLQEVVAGPEGDQRYLHVHEQISTLKEQICHLHRLIQGQHRHLHDVIQEAEELRHQLQQQEEKIEELGEKVALLEAQNQELRDKVRFWSHQPKKKVSTAVGMDPPRDLGVSPYSMLTKLRKQKT
ncbi:coiled-coil domain-containing protein 68 [Strigops habroptila]|uniref:Coiled-coil domain containing 68 n=1 Tax=Strigops habroptila TaxID=2489341 RepID=A0A672UK34_STRHB|nr:coiled-coil domain-containing protein 68 [Strigops habroptila]